MGQRLRVLIIEDSVDDATLEARELRRAGYEVEDERVQTAEELRSALARQTWDVVLADYTMPSFSGVDALRILRQLGRDEPFILVSGTIGETVAVAAMRAGANDYLLKGDLARLAPAVARELRDAETRHQKARADQALRFFSEAGEALTESLDPELTIARVARLAVPFLGDHCTVDLVADGAWGAQSWAVAHKDPAKEPLLREMCERYPLEQRWGPQKALAMSTRESQVIEEISDATIDAHARDARHRSLLHALDVRALMTLPLVARGRTLGVLTLAGMAARRFGPEDLAFAQVLAHRAALAIDNAVLFRATKLAEDRQRLLVEAGSALAVSLDVEATLPEVARLLVPALADLCAIDLVLGPRSIRTVALSHVRPEEQKRALEIWRAQGADLDAPSGVAAVLRGAAGVVVTERDDGPLAELARALELGAYMTLPFGLQGCTFGALTLAKQCASRPFAPEDATIASELAQHCASAVEHAWLYEEARAAIRARDDFMAIAAHELRTPLTPLLLHLEGITARARKRREDERPEQAMEHMAAQLEAMRLQLRRLVRLVDELVEVPRISNKPVQLELETFDLAEIVREVAVRFAREMERARCPLDLRCDASVKGRWDRLRVEQIVTNLLSNAIKFGAGKPIEVRVEACGPCARLAVSDHGIGIAPADQARIFERFERAVSVRHFGGLGLGLWITRRIVDAFGGSIRVESAPGAGATFVVDLPSAPISEAT